MLLVLGLVIAAIGWVVMLGRPKLGLLIFGIGLGMSLLRAASLYVQIHR